VVVKTNLPAELSSFVGRQAQVDRGVALAARSRLLSLVGPGGAGKTRLARRIAAGLLGEYPAGVWWVELAALGDRAQAEEALARAMGVPALATAPARRLEVLAGAVGDGALVLLDNCEHLLGAVAEIVDALLRAAPGTRVIATSREPLAVEGEVVWRVPPLEVPPVGAAEEAVWGYEGVRLFTERAVAAMPDLVLPPAAATDVAGICRALDGMPLALELAAARIGVMSVPTILAALDDRFRVLSGGPRPAAPRLRSMLASVEWSHDLCSDGERALLRRLSVFVGGFDADAAVRVAGFTPLDAATASGVLSELVAKSLVQVETTRAGRTRFRLLETVRVYARERCAEAGEAATAAERHLAWSAELAESLQPATTRCDIDALNHLERELPNLRAALDHAARTPSVSAALRLIAALGFYWARRGHGISGTDLGEDTVAAARAAPPGERGRAWWAIAYARFYGGSFPDALEAVTRALGDATEADDTILQAHCHTLLGGLQSLSDPAAARVLLEQALAAAEETGDDAVEYAAVGLMAFSLLIQHRPAEADEFVQRSATVAAAIGDRFGQAWAHLDLGMTHQAAGRFLKAREAYRAGIAAGEEIGDPLVLLYGYSGLTNVELATGRWVELVAVADAMNRPELRFADLTLAFASALRRIAAFDSDPAAGSTALVAGGEVIIPYVPFEAPRLMLEGARHAIVLGDLDTAERAGTAAMAACEAIGSAHAGACRVLLARVRRARGDDPVTVEQLAHDGLAEIAEAQLWVDVPEALDVLGTVALDTDRAGAGTRLFAAADTLNRRAGRLDPFAGHLAAEHGRAADLLGEAFDETWAAGSALEAPGAVAYARRARGRRRRPRFGWASLTPTELEVARLAAAGHSNPVIASRLFVSRATVKTHLVHVFSKLGLTTRAELAAAAARHGLG